MHREVALAIANKKTLIKHVFICCESPHTSSKYDRIVEYANNFSFLYYLFINHTTKSLLKPLHNNNK